MEHGEKCDVMNNTLGEDHFYQMDNQVPLYSCMATGAKNLLDDAPFYSRWISARRRTLNIFDSHLIFGDWVINYDVILSANLFKTKSGIISSYLLKIQTPEGSFQFGLSANKFWSSDLPFVVKRMEGKPRGCLSPCAVKPGNRKCSLNACEGPRKQALVSPLSPGPSSACGHND